MVLVFPIDVNDTTPAPPWGILDYGVTLGMTLAGCYCPCAFKVALKYFERLELEHL